MNDSAVEKRAWFCARPVAAFAAWAIVAMMAGCGQVTSVRPDQGVDAGLPFFETVQFADGGQPTIAATPAPIPDGGVLDANVADAGTAGPVSFFAVSGSSPTNVVIVGSGGAIARWNGKSLLAEQSGTTNDLRGVFVVRDDLAWAVGAAGTIVRWNGVNWGVQDPGTNEWLSAVWDDGQNKMFAVGVKGTIVGFDGAWKTIPMDTQDDLYAVTGSGAGGTDTVVAVGALGTIAKYDGKMFHRTTLPGFSRTLAGAATGPAGVWFVGLDGAAWHYDSGPTALTDVPGVYLRGVAAPGPDVWMVGFDATIARLHDGKLQTYTDVPQRWYEGVWASSSEDVWVVGASGTILHSRPQHIPDGGVDAASPIVDGGGAG